MGAASERGPLVANRYRLDDELGEGGMGAVHAATDTETGARVAVKTVLDEVEDAPSLQRRLEREAAAAALLQHPHIVEVRALHRLDDGSLALVMELVEGRSLDALIEEGPLAPARALSLIRQALRAVGHAHGHGLVHRDLKPANLIVEPRPGEPERLKVLDFGLVKLVGDIAQLLGDERLTRTGVVHGTPAYMAPEQALGRPIDGRVDIYALGAVLFDCLAGRPPFQHADPIQLVRMQVKAEPPTLASATGDARFCTPALEAVIARALAKSPGERFQSATDMIGAVDAAIESLP